MHVDMRNKMNDKQARFFSTCHDFRYICERIAIDYPDVFDACLEKYNAMDMTVDGMIEILLEVKDALDRGRSIEAIKAIRRYYDLGLKDSKTIIDTVKSQTFNGNHNVDDIYKTIMIFVK